MSLIKRPLASTNTACVSGCLSETTGALPSRLSENDSDTNWACGVPAWAWKRVLSATS